MRAWQICAASVVAATLADGVLLLAAGLPERGYAWDLLVTRWPAAVGVWLAAYGCAAALLSILATVTEGRRAGEPGAIRQYFGHLVTSQYFTAATALFALFLWRMPVEAGGARWLPQPFSQSPALLACDAVLVVGLFGALVVAAATAWRGRVMPQPPAMGAELLLLREVRDLLRARDPAGTIPAADAARLIEAVEQGQRSMQEGLKGLAGAVGRLGRSLRDYLQNAKTDLQERGAGPPVDIGAIEHSIVQLRAAVAALEASVEDLKETASVLAGQPGSPLSAASRSRVSAELQELMRAMPPEAADGERPG